ncbi:hypothetical protein [Kitasatospora sp. NPDC088346]|uniref:hypothetical protein n=1 Tax=Kitasatospora sp. NPDC088346 TaxID=3364073 RepID=UPI003816F00E
MADAPTLVEVTTQPPPPVPPMPAAPPTAGNPPVAPVPGLPLAAAAANAVGAVTTGALSLGGPLSLAAATVAAGVIAVGTLAHRTRAAHRTGALGTTRSTAGTLGAGGNRGSALRTSAGAGHVPGARRSSGAAGGGLPWSGQARPSASGLRAAARTAQHRTTTPAGTTPRPHGAAGSPAAGTAPGASPRGSAGMPSVGLGRPRTTAAGAARTAGSSGRSGAGHRGGSNRGTGAGGWREPGWAARSVAKGAQGNAPGLRGGSGGRWPEASAGRAAKIADRTEKRLIKGRERAMRKAGLDPATGLTTPTTTTKTRAKGGKSSVPVVSTPEQRKALKRSAWRYRARMTGAVLGTGLVGLGSVLAFNWRHRGMVASHMRRTWWRLAGNARSAREARDAAIAGTDLTGVGEVPVPAETVNDPARKAKPTATSALKRRAVQAPTVWTPTRVIFGWRPEEATMPDSQSTVPAFSLSSAADVMLQAASTFDPEHMTEFEQLVNDLPGAFLTIQDVLRVLAELSAERLPVDPAVVEEIGEGYRAMGKVVAALEEVPVIYRRVHEADIERIENPRNGVDGERRWNVQ